MSFGYWVSRVQFKSTNQAKYCCMVVDNDNRLLSDAYDTFDTLSMKNSRFSIIMCYKQNSRIMGIVYHKILKIYLNLIRMSLLNIWPTQLKTMLMRIFLVLKICPVFISKPFIFFPIRHFIQWSFARVFQIASIFHCYFEHQYKSTSFKQKKTVFSRISFAAWFISWYE